ncbi:MAG: hypothetical protein AAGM22_29660 [Acidobacteriota bacterium]
MSSAEMKQGIRAVVVLSASVLAIVTVAVFAYDRVVFDQNSHIMNLTLHEAEKSERTPPELVMKFLTSPSEIDATVFFVANLFLTRAYLDRSTFPTFPLLDQLLWTQLLKLRYSSEEIAVLYCSVASVREAEGLDQISRELFGAPPESLNSEQLAFTLAAIRSPTLLKRDRARLERFAGDMLQQAGAARPGT